MNLRQTGDSVDSLIASEGWSVYYSELKREFDKEMARLRRYAKKNDEEHFLKVAGRLDGLEFAMTLPDKIIQRGKLT